MTTNSLMIFSFRLQSHIGLHSINRKSYYDLSNIVVADELEWPLIWANRHHVKANICLRENTAMTQQTTKVSGAWFIGRIVSTLTKLTFDFRILCRITDSRWLRARKNLSPIWPFCRGIILVFWAQSLLQNSKEDTSAEVLNLGLGKMRFSIEIALENDTR